MWLDVLHPKHYKALYEIAQRAEPWVKDMPLEQFAGILGNREGYVVVNSDGRLAGCVSFSDYVPQGNIIIHCFIDIPYQSRWARKNILKTICGYVFNDLEMPRVSGFCFKDLSDSAGDFLLRLGFKEEGCIRNGIKLQGRFYDTRIFGMLRDECKWLK